MNDVFNYMPVVFLVILALKTMIGYHFPWETCPCCGKNYRDHDK